MVPARRHGVHIMYSMQATCHCILSLKKKMIRAIWCVSTHKLTTMNAQPIQFCPACGDTREIAKTDEPTMTVDYEQFIREYKDATKTGTTDTLNFGACSWTDIQKSVAFTKLLKKNRRALLIRIPKGNGYCYNCTGCLISTPIKPGSCWNDYTTYATLEEEDYSRYIHNKTLPIVDSVCSDDECKNKKAIYLREDTVDGLGGVLLIHICTKCGAHQHLKRDFNTLLD